MSEPIDSSATAAATASAVRKASLDAARHPSAQRGQPEFDFANIVPLTDYIWAWFLNIHSTFAANRVTRSITKFH
jgi:hypothetical protein